MLEAIGSCEDASGETCCCDVCGCTRLVATLRFEDRVEATTVSRKRRTAVYCTSEDLLTSLRERLQLARDQYMADHPAYKMFGADSVCSDSLIDYICTQAKFIGSQDDLCTIFPLRPELRTVFSHNKGSIWRIYY